MGLFSPWFLAGLLALGLPVWLHLLRQFKRTPRPFSSLLFFERRVQSSTRHRRLRYLALLSMRIAILALLALAFANPFVYRRQDRALGRKLTIIAVDRSFSMRTTGRMDAARRTARRLLNGLPARASVQLLAFDSHVENMTASEDDKSVVASAIDTLQPDDAASSYGELTRALRVLEQTSGARLDVHVITDAQQTSMPASFHDLQVGPHTALNVHVVGKPVANWAVESVNAPARVFGSGTADISATVASWNSSPAAEKVLLQIDARTVASQNISLPCPGKTTAEFHNVSIPYGAHRGLVRIQAHDNLPDDDQYAFAIERADPRKVLFLYSSGRERESFYYKAALEASAATGLTVQPLPLERLADEPLRDYAFLVVNDPGDLPDSLTQRLTTYVQNGGALLVAIGPATANSGRVPVAGNAVQPSGASQMAGSVDREAPELTGLGHLENVTFLHTPRVELGAGDRLLARFADGSPLLIEKRSGEGRLLVLASTLENSSNDFPLHSSFVPFVAQTARYLSGTEDTPSSLVAGTPVLLRHTLQQNTAADVVGPDNKHELSLHDATRAMSYNPMRAGFYEVQRAGGQRFLVGVNADRRESDLTPISPETLSLWNSIGQGGRKVTATVERTVVPWSLWRYVLLLVLSAALVESLFAGRYLRRER